jgi:membrane-bound lytic murein transglycosylase F
MNKYNASFLPKLSLQNNVNFKFKAMLMFVMLCLYSLLLTGCENKDKQTNLQHIIDRGYVRVGTLYGSNTYYIGAQGATGFEYELAKKYANFLGVKLKMVPRYNIADLFPMLDSGEVDFLASGLSVTPKRLEQYDFSPSYDEVSQKLIFKQGNIRPRNLDDLTGELMVTAKSSHAENLAKLKLTHDNLQWQETNDYDNEELLEKVLAGEIDYTVMDSNTLAINRRYHPEISIGFSLTRKEPLAWALKKQADNSIFASLIEFFGQVHHDGTLLALDDKYYGHIEQFNYVDTRLFIRAINHKLPKYKPVFQKYGEDIDWRLLAAISYQESHWNPRARSYTGVRGMMMLTLPTARQMGIKSRLDVEQSIRGGAKYFKRMIDKMPARIASPDRTWFALASYNIGFGHLNDARIITQRQGGDPDRWFDVKLRLPLLKQKKYYKKTKYGYARGDEPVRYVENIRRYYQTLTMLDERKFNKKMKEIAENSAVNSEQKQLKNNLADLSDSDNVVTPK